VKRRKGDYPLFPVLSNILQNVFKQKDSMINTSTITAVTKSSIKPLSGATTNCPLCDSGERNGEKRRTKVSFGRTMMQALELGIVFTKNDNFVRQSLKLYCRFMHLENVFLNE